jgi:hypothetical protein
MVKRTGAEVLRIQESALPSRYRKRMKRASALDRIVTAFADAAASGDFEQAEGWISLARDNYGRNDESAPMSGAAAPRTIPSERSSS